MFYPHSNCSFHLERDKFVIKHRRKLIEKVVNVQPILDMLLEERVLNQEGVDDVRSKTTKQEMMRELYKHLNNSKAQCIFYNCLLEYEKSLLYDL